MDRSKILLFAFVAFCVSLALPGVVFIDQAGTHSIYGILILAIGWGAVTKWVFAWFANPLFLFAVFRSRVEKPAMTLIVSIIAFGLGLSAYMLKEIPQVSGVESTVEHLAIGYYVWMLSLGLLVWYGFLRYHYQEKYSERVSGQATRIDFSTVFKRYTQPFIGLVIMIAMLVYAVLKM